MNDFFINIDIYLTDLITLYIDVKIQEVKTEDEMNILFQKVNKSRPSIILKNSNIQVIINQFRKLFKVSCDCILYWFLNIIMVLYWIIY